MPNAFIVRKAVKQLIGTRMILNIRFRTGEWNEQSAWPQRRGQVAMEEGVRDEFVEATGLAMM